MSSFDGQWLGDSRKARESYWFQRLNTIQTHVINKGDCDGIFLMYCKDGKMVVLVHEGRLTTRGHLSPLNWLVGWLVWVYTQYFSL